MRFLKKFKPAFWDHRDISDGQFQVRFNFRRKWILLVVFTSFMALSPLFVMSLVELSLTKHLIENEVKTSMQKILESVALSSTLTPDAETFAKEYVSNFDLKQDTDLFLLNKDGQLITPSFHLGSPGQATGWEKVRMEEESGVLELAIDKENPLIIAYAKVPNTDLALVLARTQKGLTDLWLKPRLQLTGYLSFSIILILLSIIGTATYLINRIHSADRKRIEALHHAEHANKIASIGRLASGVAHEINNPLAIINQKTGLMLDLLSMKADTSEDDRTIQLAKDTLDAVTRCGTITRRLLDFARHMEPSIELINLEEVVSQMLAFLEKEAHRRNITLSVDNKAAIEKFHCDKGSLQQIFLNLFENAFAAMENGGKLMVTIRPMKKGHIEIKISDNGKGIAKEDIPKIFEPFYSSKNEHWGTGLGLSITYGLVKELGGDIMVKSELGRGTQFTLILPLKTESTEQLIANSSPNKINIDTNEKNIGRSDDK